MNGSIRKYFQRLFDRKILRQLEPFIERARFFGLSENDVENALSYIEYYEFEISFDIVAQQSYEYELKVDEEFYSLAMDICETLKIDKDKYKFLKELIRNT